MQNKSDFEQHYWYQGDVVSTMAFNAISLMFPILERFVIESVRYYRHQVSDENRAMIGRLIREEAAHSSWHLAMNAAQNLSTQDRLQLEERLKGRLTFVTQFMSPLSKLAMTVAGESFTARLAQRVLDDSSWFDEVDSQHKDIWLAHAKEELEHAELPLKIYQAIGGGRVRLGGMKILSGMLLSSLIFETTYYLLKKEKVEYPRYRAWHWLWCMPGLLR